MYSMKDLSPSITDMIRFDHSHVMLTSHQYVVTKKPAVKKALAETVCDALEIHATLEEEIFYPAMRALGLGGAALAKSVPEHKEMRALIASIRRGDASSARYDELFCELMRDVIHHVADEETVLLPDAERSMTKRRLNELGVQMTSRRMQLLAPKAGKAAVNTAIGFSSSTTAVVLSAVSALLVGRFLTKKLA
ncbi:cation-binding protein [Massilia eurypsychrophila]|uniref:Cation-binding protein n=1 Tax=Massilia eurypsychrophila TaxID=1485217 RepID=A0A2G8TCJ9_9BURK|nr:hemerythrin domain-containing protein [Massilia eurypsychrophila]PIL43771.1 cation-binding protein [Massilia eurypsychrophila]